MRLPHLIHRDPAWCIQGIFALYQCRCGARRVTWVTRSLYGPVPEGFPLLEDRHGRQVTDSGWHHIVAASPDRGITG